MNIKQLIDSELNKKTFAEINIFKLLKCYLIAEEKNNFQYKNEFTDYLLSLGKEFNLKVSNFEREKNPFGLILPAKEFHSNEIKWCEYDKDIIMTRVIC